jgi:hypothetical protein
LIFVFLFDIMTLAMILLTQGSVGEERSFDLLDPLGCARYSVIKGIHRILKSGGTADEIRPDA